MKKLISILIAISLFVLTSFPVFATDIEAHSCAHDHADETVEVARAYVCQNCGNVGNRKTVETGKREASFCPLQGVYWDFRYYTQTTYSCSGCGDILAITKTTVNYFCTYKDVYYTGTHPSA